MCTGMLSGLLYGLSIPAKIEDQHVEHVQRKVNS